METPIPASQSTFARSARLSAFASRNFVWLWLGQAISVLGDKFTEIAVPVLVYRITGSAVQLGLAFVSQTAAALAFGLVAGALSDRWDQRRTMIGSDLIRAALVLSIPVLPMLPVTAGAKLVLLYALGFSAAAVKQFFLPARVSLIPRVVVDNQLVSANSADEASMSLMEVVGYAAAGVLIQAAGFGPAFIVDGATFLISALCIWRIALPPADRGAPARARQPLITEIRAGLQQAWTTPLLRATLILSSIAPMALGATWPLAILFSHKVLKAGDMGFALTQAMYGLGLSLGVVVVGRIAENRPRGQLLIGGVMGMGLGQLGAYGLPFLLAGLLPDSPIIRLAIAMPFFFIAGTAHSAVFLGIRTVVQENSPPEMIGRVFSVIIVLSSAAMAAGAALSGLADVFGVGAVLLFWAIFLTLSGVLAASWRPLRGT